MRRQGQGNLTFAAGALVLALGCAACATGRMVELARDGDHAAQVISAWRTEGGGLALMLAGMETAWSEGSGLVAIAGAELEQALAGAGADSADSAALPVVLLPRARLLADWQPGHDRAPTLLEEVPADRAGAAGWAQAQAAGVDADGRPLALRVVYRCDHPAPHGEGQQLLALLVVSRDPATAKVRRAVFLVDGYQRGLWRQSALVALGVVVDVGLLALLVI